MKTLIFIFFSLLTAVSFAQVANNGPTPTTAQFTSAFINASNSSFQSSNGFSQDGSGNNGKGIVFPRTNLTSFTFATFSPGDFPSNLDGMIVFNNGSGSTPATGSGMGNQAITPGFYYFSNPGSTFNTNSGQWLPLGGSTTKTTVINTVPADGINTVLDLQATGASVVGTLGPITRYLEAKIYDDSGKLVMTASSEYDIANNILTTGNGGVNTLLSTDAGPYTVLLSYE